MSHGAFKRSVCCATVLVGCVTSGWGQSYWLQFDEQAYDTCPGEDITLEVHLRPVPPGGLFAYGVRIALVGNDPFPLAQTTLILPPELDYSGIFGPGAERVLSAEFIAAKGTTGFFVNPPAFYEESLLATLTITNAPSGSWVLELDRYVTLGTNESVFVDGDANSLDQSLGYRSAVLNVGVPRPVIEHMFEPGTGVSTSTLTFLTCPGYDYFAQYTDQLAPGVTWTAVEGAPHNAGVAIDVSLEPQRFYRVEVKAQR